MLKAKSKQRTFGKQPGSCYLQKKTGIFSPARQEKILKVRCSQDEVPGLACGSESRRDKTRGFAGKHDLGAKTQSRAWL